MCLLLNLRIPGNGAPPKTVQLETRRTVKPLDVEPATTKKELNKEQSNTNSIAGKGVSPNLRHSKANHNAQRINKLS